MSDPTLILYAHPLSGHSHRARLMLSLLGTPHEIRLVDLRAGAQKAPDFVALNPFGTVPVLVHGDTVVSDSAAILVYLALTFDAGRTWLPAAPAHAADVQRWLSVAQGPLYRGPHLARLEALFGFGIDGAAARRAADDLLTVLDAHLDGRAWLCGEGPTIADVANYGYVAMAPQGGVDLEPYPHVKSWLARIEGLDRFTPVAGPSTGAEAN